MSGGIYAYWDNKLNYYVYVGKDSHIDEDKRHRAHHSPSSYDEQQINRVIQNNPKRYEYRVLIQGDYTEEQLNIMEKFLIKHLKTCYYDYPERHVFNFTAGGDGVTGLTAWNKNKSLSKQHRQRLSESHKGKCVCNDNHAYKDYARVLKMKDKTKQGYSYFIQFYGKKLKQSVCLHKLYKWWGMNYPNELLFLEI